MWFGGKEEKVLWEARLWLWSPPAWTQAKARGWRFWPQVCLMFDVCCQKLSFPSPGEALSLARGLLLAHSIVTEKLDLYKDVNENIKALTLINKDFISKAYLKSFLEEFRRWNENIFVCFELRETNINKKPRDNSKHFSLQQYLNSATANNVLCLVRCLVKKNVKTEFRAISLYNVSHVPTINFFVIFVL